MARHSKEKRNAEEVALLAREIVHWEAKVHEYDGRWVVNIEETGVDAPMVVPALQKGIDRFGLAVWVEPINSALIGVYDR